MLNTDIVESDIPLLLSRRSMKNADMTIDFKNDNAFIFGQPTKLFVTKSGHYAIPISPFKTILNNVTTGTNTNVTLIATESNRWKSNIALKLQTICASTSREASKFFKFSRRTLANR